MSDDVFSPKDSETIVASGGQTGLEGLTLSDVFRLLANQRRRYLLYQLHGADDAAFDVDDLVNTVANLEAADREDHRRDVGVDLRHNHLPKLANAGVLEYDERSDVVRYWQRPAITEWLEHAKWKELGTV